MKKIHGSNCNDDCVHAMAGCNTIEGASKDMYAAAKGGRHELGLHRRYLPGDEGSDAKCVLLEQIADQGSHESTHFPYREDREEPDYIDEHALHRLVEDLQFGHDLRL